MSVSSDSDGMVVEELAELLKTQRIKGVYVVPNFGNPSGITLSAARRELLVKLAAEHNFLIIEDDPYGELRFTEERHPTLHQVSQRVLGNTDHIIYTSTFSKIPAPGLRLGWAILPPFLLHKVAIIKQAADLHASALSQSIVECYLGPPPAGANRQDPRRLQTEGRDPAGLVEQELGDYITFDKPKGGMFLWARFRQPFNATEWLNATLQQGVVFVPGNTSSPTTRIVRPSACRSPPPPNSRCRKRWRVCAVRCNPRGGGAHARRRHQTAIFTSPCRHVAVM